VTNTDKALSRRRLLRGAAVAGAAAAGAAGAGLAVAQSGTAQAVTGDPVKQGLLNLATTTTEVSTPSETTLSLGNPKGYPLGLFPTGAGAVGGGDLSVSTAGELRVSANPTPVSRRVYTDKWALTTVTVPPTRVLDTRSAAGLANVFDGAQYVSSGRLAAGATIIVALDNLVSFGEGVRINLTVTKTNGSGYVTVWGRGSKPSSSSLNFWTADQTLANCALSQLGRLVDGSNNLLSSDVIAITTTAPTAIVVDVNAFIVAVPVQVTDFNYPAAAVGLSATNSRGFATGPAGRDFSRYDSADRTLRIGE
jgi:hypothetical protein